MDNFINSVPALVWLLLIVTAVFMIMFVWHKEKSKLETKSVDALRAIGEDVVAAIDKIVELESADVAQRAKNLLVLRSKAASARQAIAARAVPAPSVGGGVSGAPGG